MQRKGPITRLLDNIAQKRLFGIGPNDDFSYVDQMGGPVQDIKLLGKYSGLTYRCIDTIAEAMGRYNPYLYTLGAQNKETQVVKHPFIDLLHNPNPDLSMFQLFEGSASFVEQFGEFFWYMVPGQITGYKMSGPKEIYLLRPDRMGVSIDKQTGEVIGYTYHSGMGKKIPFAPEEILHHMTFNPKNPYRGFSTVEAAIDYITTEEEVSRFTRNYFKNNAAMSGILSVNGKIAKEQWKKFVTQWREKYEGVENAGKVALVRDSQIDFKPIGSSVKDMDMTALKQTTVEQILMMFKIPKGILGMEEGTGLGRASVETLEYIFAKWTIDGKMARFDDTLQRAIDRYFKGSKIQVGHVTQIPVDKEYQLKMYEAGVDKWLTRKEIRAADPETASTNVDGDDQLFVPINMVPLGTAANPPAPTAATPPAADANDPEDDPNQGGDGGADEDTEDQTKAVKITLTKSKKKVGKSLDYNVIQKEKFRNELEQNAAKYVSLYKGGVESVLKKQEGKVITRLGHLSAGLKRGIADPLLDMSEEDAEFNSTLAPILSSLVAEQGQLAFEFAGASGEYTITQSIMDAITKSTKRMSSNFDQITLQQLNDTLAEGVAAGEGLSKLTKRVEVVYSEAKGYRAERVARTESQGASNAATVDAYKQTHYVTAMTWFANPGACAYCQELDGTTIGLTETFVNQGDSVDVTNDSGDTSSYQADYGNVDAPPLHPNCTCTIIPVTSAN